MTASRRRRGATKFRVGPSIEGDRPEWRSSRASISARSASASPSSTASAECSPRRCPSIRSTASARTPTSPPNRTTITCGRWPTPAAQAVKAAGITGDQVEAIALDTTGSSVIPVGEGLVPLDDYYLWCDHRAKDEAAEITDWAHREKLKAIEWCGGVYSAEWGFAKLLHWLRHNPDKRDKFVTAFEHCDMVAATLAGITDPKTGEAEHLRGRPQVAVAPGFRRAAAGELSSSRSIRCSRACAPSSTAQYATSDQIEGHLSRALGGEARPQGRASRSRSAPSTRIGTRSARAPRKATWSTSSARRPASSPTPARRKLIPGFCGVVRGSVHPQYTGIEAGLSARRRRVQRHRDARPDRRSRSCRRASTNTAPARPASCGSRGTTATARCWSTPMSAASPSAGT